MAREKKRKKESKREEQEKEGYRRSRGEIEHDIYIQIFSGSPPRGSDFSSGAAPSSTVQGAN